MDSSKDFIIELLKLLLKNKASDLHLSAGLPPAMRIDGELNFLQQESLSNETLQKIASEILTPQQYETFKKEWEYDFAYQLPDGSGRFRVNFFQQLRGMGMVFRPIPLQIPTFEQLELAPIFADFCHQHQGLILLTGPTGSGKSTTLAAMINYINETESNHIITIEDPIEFVYTSKKSLINQREVGRETKSFNAALRAVLREDPDIILVGEMRDLETIRLALTAAETGHLVFATLHTSSAPKTINRIVDVFPGSEKDLIRSLLAESLYAVVAQQLIRRSGGGRIAAQEIMICTAAIRNLIRENKIAQIYSAMQSAQATGMRTLEQHLEELKRNQKI